MISGALMAGEIEIVQEDPRWAALDLPPLAGRAVAAVLADVGLRAETVEISLLACDDARIAVLNADFRGKGQPTNVLSWPARDLCPPDLPVPGPDGAVELGDIALAYDTCAREAEAAQKPLTDHVTHLIVHAVLHLLGYDHENDADATLMEAREVAILATLGCPDPYRG